MNHETTLPLAHELADEIRRISPYIVHVRYINRGVIAVNVHKKDDYGPSCYFSVIEPRPRDDQDTIVIRFVTTASVDVAEETFRLSDPNMIDSLLRWARCNFRM